MNWQVEVENSWPRISRQLQSGLCDPSLRLAVLAAHPDDETIGASVVLSRFSALIVIYLTDGAPNDRALWSPDAKGSREDYARTRRGEAEKALAEVNVASEQTIWLGGVDQGAIFDVSGLAARLIDALRAFGPDLLITHSYEGGHPDHDTAALVARLAQLKLMKKFLLLEMTSYHASGEDCETGVFLESDQKSEVVFEIFGEDLARKMRMVEHHASQSRVLAGFTLHSERLRLAPEHDFSRPPHLGRLWYERMNWGMTGEHWRELAAPAINEMQVTGAAHSS